MRKQQRQPRRTPPRPPVSAPSAARPTRTQSRRRRVPLVPWIITLLAAAISFYVGVNLPVSTTSTEAPPVLHSSLPPASRSIAGVSGLSAAAGQALAAEVAAAAAVVEARQQQEKFTVPPDFRGKTIEAVPVSGDRKVIALTFDDGPWPEATNSILYILRQYNVRATFFMIGRNVRNFPERARQVVEHGHAVANHSWNHRYHVHAPAEAAAEIDNTDIWIERATGVRSHLFRPPGGFMHTGMPTYAAGKGQVVVMWSADSKDYYASSARIVSNVLSKASPGGIVLFHDGGGDRRNTIAALPKIITSLREQGYEFVTVPQLLELQQQQQQLQATKG